MSTLQDFRRRFAYDEWANREVLAALRAPATPPPVALDRMAHILSAQYVWFDRLRQQAQTFPVWPHFTRPQCEAEAAKLAALWKDHLNSLQEADLQGSVAYKNTKGEPWTSRVDDILMHVILHSAYHRGQIASDMRAAGFTPASTDFILAIRQGFVD
jgi:uncharacterized damage-inducible protein DinB